MKPAIVFLLLLATFSGCAESDKPVDLVAIGTCDNAAKYAPWCHETEDMITVGPWTLKDGERLSLSGVEKNITVQGIRGSGFVSIFPFECDCVATFRDIQLSGDSSGIGFQPMVRGAVDVVWDVHMQDINISTAAMAIEVRIVDDATLQRVATDGGSVGISLSSNYANAQTVTVRNHAEAGFKASVAKNLYLSEFEATSNTIGLQFVNSGEYYMVRDCWIEDNYIGIRANMVLTDVERCWFVGNGDPSRNMEALEIEGAAFRAPTATAWIHNSSFVDNVGPAVSQAWLFHVYAQYNWWDDPAGPEVVAWGEEPQGVLPEFVQTYVSPHPALASPPEKPGAGRTSESPGDPAPMTPSGSRSQSQNHPTTLL